jgi:hypothetical protein
MPPFTPKPNTTKGQLKSMRKFPDDYEHLKLFLHREDNKTYKTNQEYLLVSPNIFSKVKILNIDTQGFFIDIDIEDYATNKKETLRIDMTDDRQRYLFVHWDDVKDMVYHDPLDCEEDNSLLEFEL